LLGNLRKECQERDWPINCGEQFRLS